MTVLTPGHSFWSTSAFPPALPIPTDGLARFGIRVGAGSDSVRTTEANTWFLAEARAIALPHERLRIARVSYGSPGSIDLLGIGKVFEVLVNVFARSVAYFDERDLRRERLKQAKLETRKAEIELEWEKESVRALKLENARMLLEIRQDYPDWSEDHFLLLAVGDQDKMWPQISEGKLVGAKSVEDDPPREDEAA